MSTIKSQSMKNRPYRLNRNQIIALNLYCANNGYIVHKPSLHYLPNIILINSSGVKCPISINDIYKQIIVNVAK